MRKCFTLSFLFTLLILATSTFGQAFHRIGNLPIIPGDECGWGNAVISDFDMDGKPEIIAVNNNYNDGPNELIPKITKFEFNGTGWDSVWGAAVNTFGAPKQNTWPGLCQGDWDNDGKTEIIWAPANFIEAGNTQPNRIFVYKPNTANNSMGVLVSGTTYKANAVFKITDSASLDIRPFKMQLIDLDNDGKLELVFADRSASMRYGVISVDKIPANGDGSEVWTLEASGLGKTIDASVIYDFFVLGNTAYFIHQNGKVTPLKATAPNTYVLGTPQSNLVPGGSWKTAVVGDINNDAVDEVVVGGFLTGNQKVWLLQKTTADTLKSTMINDLTAFIGTGARIYGADAGDIDNNNKVDFIFGTRDAVPNASIVRMEYLGGDITLPASYTTSRIDSLAAATGGRWDIIKIGNVDYDGMREVVYGNGVNGTVGLTLIDKTGQLPVELKTFTAQTSKNGVTLNWSTATELNNSGFEIQRSNSNGNFVTVAFVKGAGSSSELHYYQFLDKVAEGKFQYRLKQVDFNGAATYSDVVNVNMNIPSVFTLSQNYPNPFNPSTSISFSIPEKGNVSLKVYSITGQEIATVINNEQKEAGNYSVFFNAKNLPSGVYVYRLSANGKMLSQKMNLVK